MGTTTRTVTYEKWLNMPVMDDAIEEAASSEVRMTPPNKWKYALIAENVALGVPQVWAPSPEARTFEVLQLQEGRLRTTQVVTQGHLSPQSFPDMAVEVSSVWPD